MSLAADVIKLAPVRMGDLVHSEAATQAVTGVTPTVAGGYVPPHLRGKTVEIPTFTEGEFPSIGTKQIKTIAGGGNYLSVSKKQGSVDFKEMMKAQEEKQREIEREREASENDERLQMMKDGWVFLRLSDAKDIIQRW